jgi:DNA (cytosine-5)-methyltransferase 1
MALIPTPKALDGIKGNLKTSQQRIDAGHFVDLTNVANDLAPTLLPTTTASDWKGPNRSGSGSASTKSISTAVDQQTQWGKFEPAIRRWEQMLGRLAPSPTKPDGKDGAHRLSSAFTEWMMGLPFGWITDCGLTRNEELKACGNGVVPQQAELALTILKANEKL